MISISGDLKIKKPDERIFRLTVDKLGVAPSDCLYVDDRTENLQTARDMGMSTVLFNSRNVSYDGDTVGSFKELVEILK